MVAGGRVRGHEEVLIVVARHAVVQDRVRRGVAISGRSERSRRRASLGGEESRVDALGINLSENY